MSFFDQFDDLKYQLNKFMWPVIFLVAGIILLSIGAVPEELKLNNGQTIQVEQSPMFLYASLLFIVGAVVWSLYLFGVIKTLVGYGIMVVMLLVSVFVLYKDYMTVKVDVDYKDRWEMMDSDIKARMIDIKEAQLAYKEYNNNFTNNFDDLISFVKNGKKMKIKKVGSVPERKITPEERDFLYGDNRPIDKLMTEEEAYRLAHSSIKPGDLEGFVRDTSYVPVMQAIFKDEKYVENRLKSGCSLAFSPDSLRYVPYSTNLVIMDTGTVLKGELKAPTLQITMIHPMNEDDVYQIGDISDNHLRESWKN